MAHLSAIVGLAKISTQFTNVILRIFPHEPVSDSVHMLSRRRLERSKKTEYGRGLRLDFESDCVERELWKLAP